jgi:hypothetical protein
VRVHCLHDDSWRQLVKAAAGHKHGSAVLQHLRGFALLAHEIYAPAQQGSRQMRGHGMATKSSTRLLPCVRVMRALRSARTDCTTRQLDRIRMTSC